MRCFTNFTTTFSYFIWLVLSSKKAEHINDLVIKSINLKSWVNILCIFAVCSSNSCYQQKIQFVQFLFKCRTHYITLLITTWLILWEIFVGRIEKSFQRFFENLDLSCKLSLMIQPDSQTAFSNPFPLTMSPITWKMQNGVGEFSSFLNLHNLTWIGQYL